MNPGKDNVIEVTALDAPQFSCETPIKAYQIQILGSDHREPGEDDLMG
jgi:hypothetical protein